MHVKPTKIMKVEKLLRSPKGATIPQLQKSTAWQAHSVRAALTGLRKKGHQVQRSNDANGVATYRIIEEG